MKHFLAVIVIIVQLGALPGCRPLYEGFKAARTEECYRLPYPDQDECLRQADVRYETYEREREETRRRL